MDLIFIVDVSNFLEDDHLYKHSLVQCSTYLKNQFHHVLTLCN